MAISDPRFACEIIGKAQVLKFDDIGCMESYQRKNPNEQIRAIFYMDYARGSWLSYESAYVVQTGLLTPMNSGKVAVADTGSIQALGRSVGNPREAHP
jgi:copper chaperone NosL